MGHAEWKLGPQPHSFFASAWTLPEPFRAPTHGLSLVGMGGVGLCWFQQTESLDSRTLWHTALKLAASRLRLEHIQLPVGIQARPLLRRTCRTWGGRVGQACWFHTKHPTAIYPSTTSALQQVLVRLGSRFRGDLCRTNNFLKKWEVTFRNAGWVAVVALSCSSIACAYICTTNQLHPSQLCPYRPYRPYPDNFPAKLGASEGVPLVTMRPSEITLEGFGHCHGSFPSAVTCAKTHKPCRTCEAAPRCDLEWPRPENRHQLPMYWWAVKPSASINLHILPLKWCPQPLADQSSFVSIPHPFHLCGLACFVSFL